MVAGENNLAYCSGHSSCISVIDIKQEAFVKKIESKDLDKTKIM